MKNYYNISNQIYNKPLLISQTGFNLIHNLLQAKIAGGEMNEDFEDKEDTMIYQIDDNVGYIDINGPIGKHVSLIQKVCGVTDVNEISDAIDIVSSYPVETIVFRINSPGGSADGIPDLADKILELSQNVFTVSIVDSECCSAAYWLACATNEIYNVGSLSSAGCIGVYTFLLDETRKLKNEGYDPILIRDGKYKGAGLPGTIDDNFINLLKEDTAYISNMFKTFVKKCRPKVSDESMQGQTFFTEQAISNGLIDGKINSIKELIYK